MKRALVLLTLLALGGAGALTLSGSAGPDLPPGARLGLFVVNASGAPVSEFASASLGGGKFSLELPSSAPAAGAQYPLRRDSITWPGVFDPVSLSREVSVAELRAYVYADANSDGHFQQGEPTFEAPLRAGRDAVILVWASDAVRVQAARGFDASLNRGWNALSIAPGKSVKASPYGGAALTLNVLR